MNFVAVAGSDSLVCAAEAMPLAQSDVGLVHRLDVRLRCRDNAVTEVSAAHPPPAKKGDRTLKLT